MVELDAELKNYIWDNLEILDNIFPSKIYQKLKSLKQQEKKLDFLNDLELIFDINNEILHTIQEKYSQGLDISEYSIKDMIELLQKYPNTYNIENAKKFIGSNISDGMAELSFQIALFYQQNAQYKDALEFYQKSLHICIIKYGKSHKFTATIYSNIGLIDYFLANYIEALEYNNRALDIRLKLYKDSHPDILSSQNT